MSKSIPPEWRLTEHRRIVEANKWREQSIEGWKLFGWLVLWVILFVFTGWAILSPFL